MTLPDPRVPEVGVRQNFDDLDKRTKALREDVDAIPAVSAFGETLIDDADAKAARQTLGLNSLGTYFGVEFGLAPASVAATANTMYFARVRVLNECTLTGVAYWVGTTSAGTVKVGLYNSTGTRVASTAAGTAQGGVASFQKIPFDSTYAADRGLYFVGLNFSAGTATYFGAVCRTPANSVAAGSHTIPASITVPTTAAVVNIPSATTY